MEGPGSVGEREVSVGASSHHRRWYMSRKPTRHRQVRAPLCMPTYGWRRRRGSSRLHPPTAWVPPVESDGNTTRRTGEPTSAQHPLVLSLAQATVPPVRLVGGRRWRRRDSGWDTGNPGCGVCMCHSRRCRFVGSACSGHTPTLRHNSVVGLGQQNELARFGWSRPWASTSSARSGMAAVPLNSGIVKFACQQALALHLQLGSPFSQSKPTKFQVPLEKQIHGPESSFPSGIFLVDGITYCRSNRASPLFLPSSFSSFHSSVQHFSNPRKHFWTVRSEYQTGLHANDRMSVHIVDFDSSRLHNVYA